MFTPMLSNETVTRQDVILFLNAAFACTGQREFYDTAEEQRLSAAFLHEYMLGNYRRMYARCLAAGINDFNTMQIIFQLLASGQDTPADFRAEENALVTAALRALPVQRAWKLVSRLQKERVNNRRTRALIRAYIAGQSDLAFQAVKYRRHVRAGVVHAHLGPAQLGSAQFSQELSDFLFGMARKTFQTPLFDAFRRARYSQEAVYELPLTVAEGLAAQHQIPKQVFWQKITPRLTSLERLRVQNRTGGRVQLNPERLSLTALSSYIVSLTVAERQQRHAELSGWLQRAAQKTLHRYSGHLNTENAQSGSLWRLLGLVAEPSESHKLALVLDNSYSAFGSREKQRRPLALALATWKLFECALFECAFSRDTFAESAPSGDTQAYLRSFWTHPPEDPLLVCARGQSNLSERFLEALEWGAQTVCIVSDGVENDPPNAFHAVLVAARRLRPNVRVVHLNPAFDAEMLTVRAFSPLLPAVGLRDVDDLPTVLSFAFYASAEGKLSELEAYLALRVRQFLQDASYEGNRRWKA